jgi:Ca-activated chloride channel family protein
MTGGTFYRAEDADQLRNVFASLPREIELQTEDREVSVAFAVVGALLVLGAVGLSLLWNRTT